MIIAMRAITNRSRDAQRAFRDVWEMPYVALSGAACHACRRLESSANACRQFDCPIRASERLAALYHAESN